jgi:hypothetical protein
MKLICSNIAETYVVYEDVQRALYIDVQKKEEEDGELLPTTLLPTRIFRSRDIVCRKRFGKEYRR